MSKIPCMYHRTFGGEYNSSCTTCNGQDFGLSEDKVQALRGEVHPVPHCPNNKATLLGVNMPLATMQARIHQQNKDMGWWDKPREIGTLLCLVHSEISEAMEGARKNLMDDHLPHRSMLEVELADAMIRIMDIAGANGLDLVGAIVEKVEYNAARADHQPGARAETYGKKF